MIAQARRHLAHQTGHLHAGLDEAEDIVDEQQHIPVLVVAEILGHRQRGEADPEPAARRLIHLAEDHHHVWQHAGFPHVVIELLTFAASLADATEDAHALLVPDHVVDHLGEQDRLAYSGPAEQSRLAAALQRHEHIDNLDSRLKNLRLRGTAHQRRWSTMHRTPLNLGQRRSAVDGGAKHIEHTREGSFANRRLERPTRVLHRHAAGEALRRRQRNPAHVPGITLRQDLDDDLFLRPRPQQRVDGRQEVIEPHIHDAAAHRNHRTDVRYARLALHVTSARLSLSMLVPTPPWRFSFLHADDDNAVNTPYNSQLRTRGMAVSFITRSSQNDVSCCLRLDGVIG